MAQDKVTETHVLQEPKQDEDEHDPYCLKCGKSIAHNIPYKYEGKTFHARCLVCNFCGRNLVGKPFIVDDQNLFCGDVCKQRFETNAQGEINDVCKQRFETNAQGEINDVCKQRFETNAQGEINDRPYSEETTSLSESLIEALDRTKDSAPKPLGATHLIDAYRPDPDQITDYPRHSSPDTTSSRLSLDGSIRSYFSAVSETSLASDYSYDANRKPSRNILKNPHKPRRRPKKNVRWNLQFGNDSDTMSLESFDSASTTSSLFNRARNGVNETRQNWREFERAPSPGSTGITPSKPLYHRRFLRPNSTPHNTPHGPPSIYVPELEPTHEDVQSSSSHSSLLNSSQSHICGPSPQNKVLPSTSQNIRFTRNPSPLTSTPTTVQNQDAGGFEKLSRTILSTAVTRRQYNDDGYRSPSPGYKDEHTEEAESQLNLSDDIDSPLILKLNDSKLAELEASTLEDRERMHIYQFPQRSQNSEAANPVTEIQRTLSVRAALLNDDDQSDYDHLLPRNVGSDNNLSSAPRGQTVIANMVTLRKTIDKARRKNLISYTDDDIEDALKTIEEDETSSQSGDKPPPIPLKRGRIMSSPGEEQIPMIEKTNLYRSGSDPLRAGKTLLSGRVDMERELTIRQAPKVPPKSKQKRNQQKRSQSFSPSDGKLVQSTPFGENSEENILPPPPEFASSSIDFPSEKSSPKSDDVQSASTSTLIAEQDLFPKDMKSSSCDKTFTPTYLTPRTGQKDSNLFPLKINDRIVVGAEDPQPPLNDGVYKVPNQPKPSHSHSTIQTNWQVQSRGSTLSTHVTEYEQKIDNPRSPQYKVSMETAFAEGNLLNNTSFVPQTQTHFYPHDKAKRIHIPHRPAPLPPVSTKSLTDERSTRFSLENRQQLGKQDTSLQQLLSDLNIEDDGVQHRSQSLPGCVVCLKAIQIPRECITVNTKSYHSKCFYCSKCRTDLFRDKKPYFFHNILYCWDCYNKSSLPNPKANAYREYHRPTTGGQITTV
ncbi:uncharacterized protein LOC135342082 isoform X3 [Halichondria panicea]|uniref:uncharacterized protein LOC135342082 isoform X3 n=1 Tax=Halichondria panicea TaxID=6063 RepID=UPI00312BABDF